MTELEVCPLCYGEIDQAPQAGGCQCPEPGEAVTWVHGARGGYALHTPAVVVRPGRRTIRIRALRADGTWKDTDVRPERLRAATGQWLRDEQAEEATA